VSFQVDPLASLIAIAALVLAIVSLVQARRAPARARTAALRDQVRDLIESMDEDLAAIDSAIRAGIDVPDWVQGRLFPRYQQLKQIEPRLAGPRYSYDPLARDLPPFDADWAELSSAQKAVAHHRKMIDETIRNEEDRRREEALLKSAERRMNAATAELRGPLKVARDAVRREIDRLNRLDRGAAS